MKAEEKKRIIILIGVAILAIIVILVFTGNKSKDKEQDSGIGTSEIDMKPEDKTYSGLEFTDISLKDKDGLAVFSATVKNNGTNTSEAQWVTINVLDQNKNVIVSIPGIVEEIPAGETTTITAAMGEECADAYDVEIVSPDKES